MKQNLQTALLLSVMFLSTAAFAQTSRPDAEASAKEKKTAKTYLDLMVNVTSTNINYGDQNSALSDYKKSNKGIQAGASIQAGLTPAFSLVSELYYLRKGGTLKAGNSLTHQESSLRLNTIELPVLARFHAGRFYMNAGPSIAYNFSGNNKIDGLSTDLSFKNTEAGFKRLEAGVQMGGGVEFPFKQKRIALDIRYSHGLTNISFDKELYNRGLMVSAHFSKAWKSNPLGRK
jgi:hypothetical protein